MLNPKPALLGAVRPLIALYGYAELLWGLRAAPRRRHGRLPLYDVSIGEGSGTPNLQKLSDALDLLRQHDERRYRRLQGDVRRVIVAHYDAGYAAFMPRVGTIIVQRDFLQAQPAASAAALIVHEGAHARVWKMGVHDVERVHDRLERRCNTEMRAFAERLPNGRYLVEWADLLLATGR